MSVTDDSGRAGGPPKGRSVSPGVAAFTFHGPVVCRTISHNRDGTVDLHRLFDAVTAADFPFKVPDLSVYAELVGRPPPGPALLHVLDPDGRVLCTAGGALQSAAGPCQAHRIEQTWRRVPIPGPGGYRVQVAIAGRLVGERTFSVSHACAQH